MREWRLRADLSFGKKVQFQLLRRQLHADVRIERDLHDELRRRKLSSGLRVRVQLFALVLGRELPLINWQRRSSSAHR
jgi:hypothetical protein